jgi:glycosyltransferase involved in cell wall biosynthesis
MKPLVSILIPAYNAQEWISDTVESALAQTWPRKEIVIVDDGSKDDTLAIARRYASKEVVVVSQPNKGGAAARNTAFTHCQGDYIQWLDADDLLGRGKIANQMGIAERSGDPRILLSSAWANFMYRPGAARFSPTPLWHDLQPVEWMLRKWSDNLHMQTATWLVSRELTEGAGPWNTELLGDDDGEYFSRVVLASRGIRFVPESKVYYRIVGTNRLSYIGTSSNKLKAQLKSMQLQIGYVRAIADHEKVRAPAMSYLQTWLPYFWPERPDLVEQVMQMAAALGGELEMPRISWKYALIDRVLGRSAAKRAQLRYNHYKTFLLRSWDRALYLSSTQERKPPALHLDTSDSVTRS